MTLLDKRIVAESILAEGALLIHLDPRREAVRAPSWLKNQPQLVLQVGLDLPVPIPDLRIDHEGIYGTLSFNRSPVVCFCPWDSIFALMGDQGHSWVWPESIPEEVNQEIESRSAKKKQPELPAGKPTRKRLPPYLRVVK